MRKNAVRQLAAVSTAALAAAVIAVTVASAGPSARTAIDRSSVAIALGGEPSSWDVSLVEDGNMQSVSLNVFEGLTTRDAKMRVRPLLARSWKRTGANTWLFTLRRGVAFHNGERFDARSAAFSINRILNPKNKSQLTSFVATIKSVAAVGQYSLRVTTKGPDPNIPGVLYYVMMVPQKYVTADPKKFARQPVGTGPYRFVKWDAGQRITLSRHTGYWGTRPAIRNVTVVWRPESQVRLAALSAGEVQVAPLGPEHAKRAPRYTTAPSTDVAELGFDGQEGKPLADKRLRQAVNLSIDRRALIRFIFGGFARPANGQLVPPATLGFNENLRDYPFNLSRATSLVNAANARGTELLLVAPRGRWTKDVETAQAIAGMISKTGLRVRVEVLEFSAFLERVFDRKARADLMYFAGSSDTFDSSRVASTLLLSPDAGGVLTRYSNPRIDSLLKRALGARTLAGKEALYHQMWKTAYDDSAMMPIVGLQNIYGTAKELVWKGRPDNRIIVKEMRYR